MQLSILPLAPQYCRWTPGVLSPLFGDRRLVDQPDDAQLVGVLLSGSRQMLGDDSALDLSEHRVVVPDVMREELLQRPHGTTAGQGDRLDALAGQVAEQSAAVRAQVGERVARDEARSKATQVIGERRPQLGDLFRGHP